MSMLDRAEAFVNKKAQQTAIYLGKKSVRSALESADSPGELKIPLRKGGIFDLNRKISTKRLLEAVTESVALPDDWTIDLEASKESSQAIMPNGYGNAPYKGWLMSPVIALRPAVVEVPVPEQVGTVIHADFPRQEPVEIPVRRAA